MGCTNIIAQQLPNRIRDNRVLYLGDGPAIRVKPARSPCPMMVSSRMPVSNILASPLSGQTTETLVYIADKSEIFAEILLCCWLKTVHQVWFNTLVPVHLLAFWGIIGLITGTCNADFGPSLLQVTVVQFALSFCIVIGAMQHQRIPVCFPPDQCGGRKGFSLYRDASVPAGQQVHRQVS